MRIYEAQKSNEIFHTLIALSEAWEKENSCYGYRANQKEDIEGNRVFLAEENGKVLGYLFGKLYPAKNMTSIIPENTPYFEVEELYVIPAHRSKGIGGLALEGTITRVYQDFGVRPIVMGCHKDNDRAAAFYEKHGFQKTDYMEGNDCYYLRYPE